MNVGLLLLSTTILIDKFVEELEQMLVGFAPKTVMNIKPKRII